MVEYESGRVTDSCYPVNTLDTNSGSVSRSSKLENLSMVDRRTRHSYRVLTRTAKKIPTVETGFSAA